MVNTLAEKWIEKHVKLDELKGKIKERFERNEFGYNEEKTQRGMFLQTVVTDAYTRWTNAELACHLGLITKETLDFLYEKDLSHTVNEEQMEELQKEICTLLNQKAGLKGEFVFDWNTPINKNTDNYYGICYREAV